MTDLTAVERAEVVVAEEDAQFFLLHQAGELAEAVIGQLCSGTNEELFSYQSCKVHSHVLPVIIVTVVTLSPTCGGQIWN